MYFNKVLAAFVAAILFASISSGQNIPTSPVPREILNTPSIEPSIEPSPEPSEDPRPTELPNPISTGPTDVPRYTQSRFGPPPPRSPTRRSRTRPHSRTRSPSKETEHTVTASGVGHRSVKTEIAKISLGVRESGQNAIITQKKVAAASERLYAYLRNQYVRKLQTTGASLHAQYDFSVKPPKVTGYIGSNTVSFEVDNSKAGAILDGAVRNGASQVNSISFKPTPGKASAARKEAIRDAVRNAREEADTAAYAAGEWIGKPITIEVTDSFDPQAMRVRSAKLHKFGPTSQIAGGEQGITAIVKIKYAIW